MRTRPEKSLAKLHSIKKIVYLSYLDQEYSRSGVHFTFLKHHYHDLDIEFIKYKAPLISNLNSIYKTVHRHQNKNCILIVMSPANILVLLLRIFTRGIIVLDAGWPSSDSTDLRVKSIWTKCKSLLFDHINFRLSNLVILESMAQLNYCVAKFRIHRDKFTNLHTGFNEIMFEREKRINPVISYQVKEILESASNSNFVLFRGLDNVEAGIDKLLQSSRLLPDVMFCIASANCSRSNLPSNVHLLNRWMSSSELAVLYDAADVVLGQLGNVGRINRTIAHKIFEGAYFGKPIIATKSEALEEIFVNNSHIIFVDGDDNQDLTTTISRVLKSTNLRAKLSSRIKTAYKDKISQEVISKKFLEILSDKFDLRDTTTQQTE